MTFCFSGALILLMYCRSEPPVMRSVMKHTWLKLTAIKLVWQSINSWNYVFFLTVRSCIVSIQVNHACSFSLLVQAFLKAIILGCFSVFSMLISSEIRFLAFLGKDIWSRFTPVIHQVRIQAPWFTTDKATLHDFLHHVTLCRVGHCLNQTMTLQDAFESVFYLPRRNFKIRSQDQARVHGINRLCTWGCSWLRGCIYIILYNFIDKEEYARTIII